MSDRYLVYGLELSYFTRKLSAAMPWYGLPFERRAKGANVQAELNSRAGTMQVPILQTPENWVIADTTPIMQLLDARVPQRRMFPAGPLGVLVHIVEEWFDEWLPRTCLHYRWQYEESAQWAAAKMALEISPEGDDALRAGIAQMVTTWGTRACRATGISEAPQQQSAEAEYLRVLEALEEQLGQTAFALGDRPCAVDAVLIGGLRAHFAADPVPKRVTAKFKRITAWQQTASDWDGTGELAPFPTSTPFAQFVLREMRGSYRAFLLGNAKSLASSDKAFVATVHGEPVSLRSRPYPERSRQMVREHIARRIDTAERASVVSWLDDVGLAECFAPSPPVASLA